MKLSPLSVPYRVLQRGGSILAATAFIFFTGGSLPFGLVGPAVIVVLLGSAVLALVAYEVAYYRRYEYELTADTLDIASGVFARRTREIPLRRVQTVDISRNVVQRALGIAAVDFETAGGSETEAAVRYVSFEEAKRLQREVARLKRGEKAAGEPEAEPELLFELSDRELALVGLLSFDFRVPGVLFVLASGSVSVISSFLPSEFGMALYAGSILLIIAVVLLSWAGGAAVAVVNYYGFRLWRTDDELQYERGLFRRYDGSIPLDKVQTLTIQDTPLKRWFGYATLDIETAGYSPGGDGTRGSQSAVPLARTGRVTRLANEIEAFGDPEFERPPKRVRRRYAVRYLLALGGVLGVVYGIERFLLGPLPLPWFSPLVLLPVIPFGAHYKWLHRGFWLGTNHAVTRNGVFDRRTKIVPYYRIQTIIDSRTPFQRRLRLASVTIDTAGSRSLTGGDAAAVDVDRETANRLREALAERLELAYAARRRESEARRARRSGGARTGAEDAEAEVPPGEAASWQWGDATTIRERESDAGEGENAPTEDHEPSDDERATDSDDERATDSDDEDRSD